MPDLMQALNDYKRSKIQERLLEIEGVLPKEFFVVDYSHYPNWELPSALKLICETKEEAEEWINNNVRGVLLREEGNFASSTGARQEIRIWTKIYQRTCKKDGNKPCAGLFYRIISSNSINIALRLIGLCNDC